MACVVSCKFSPVHARFVCGRRSQHMRVSACMREAAIQERAQVSLCAHDACGGFKYSLSYDFTACSCCYPADSKYFRSRASARTGRMWLREAKHELVLCARRAAARRQRTMATTAAALVGVSTPAHHPLGRHTYLPARGACERSWLVAAMCAAECEPRARLWKFVEVATSPLSLKGARALGAVYAA
eukprot:6213612-Pleurochrysis_carterae.AAC.3